MTLADHATAEGFLFRAPIVLHHPISQSRFRSLQAGDVSRAESLLVDVLHQGQLAGPLPDIEQMRAVRDADLERLDPGVKRLMNPHIYHVSLSEKLWELKPDLINAVRPSNPADDLAAQGFSKVSTGGC